MSARTGVFVCLLVVVGTALTQNISGGPLVTKLGVSCQSPGQCGIANSECSENICKCKINYLEINNTCKFKLNSPCSSNNGCQDITDAECISNTCVCRNLTVAYGDVECLKAVYNGDVCKINRQCTLRGDDFADCNEGICGCQSGKKFLEDRCYTTIGLVGEDCHAEAKGERCYLEDDGNNQHVECVQEKCKCKSGYQPTGDNRQCSEYHENPAPDSGTLPLLSISSLLAMLLVKILT